MSETDLKVMRCRECGDTFPSESSETPCPSCGSTDLQLASEPLL